MYNHLVIAQGLDEGPYLELRGLRHGARAIITDRVNFEDERNPFKRQTSFACMEEDVSTVVDYVSKNHVGDDVYVFKLIQSHIRLPGELKSKTISKDGVLPV